MKIDRNTIFAIVIITVVALVLYFYVLRAERLVVLAYAEKFRWRNKTEHHRSMHPRLVKYWNHGAGWQHVSQNNISQIASGEPWSAAGLVFIVRKAFPNFPKASSHAKYVLWALSRRQNGKKTMIAFGPQEYKPRPGDIVVKGRAGSSPTLNTLTASTPTHGDIVVSNKGNRIKVIGFNVSDSVQERIFPAKNGYISSPHFAIIKMN